MQPADLGADLRLDVCGIADAVVADLKHAVAHVLVPAHGLLSTLQRPSEVPAHAALNCHLLLGREGTREGTGWKERRMLRVGDVGKKNCWRGKG